MKFSEFFIGMPVSINGDNNAVGVITKYVGVIDDIYYVNVDLGKYELEFSLDELKPAKGNI